MKVMLIAGGALAVLIAAVGFVHPPEFLHPKKTPESYRGKFLDEGAVLVENAAQGTDYESFSEHLARAKGAMLVETSWPDAMQKMSFDEAVRGWDAALRAWQWQKRGFKTLNAEIDLERPIIEEIHAFPGSQHQPSKTGEIDIRALVAEALHYGNDSFHLGLERPWVKQK